MGGGNGWCKEGKTGKEYANRFLIDSFSPNGYWVRKQIGAAPVKLFLSFFHLCSYATNRQSRESRNESLSILKETNLHLNFIFHCNPL
jgi:hypothetical protein